MRVPRKLIEILRQQRQKRLRPKKYGNIKILKKQKGHDLVKDFLKSRESGLISRLGSVELSCIYNIHLKKIGEEYNLNDKMKWSMTNNAGFYPVDDRSLELFS